MRNTYIKKKRISLDDLKTGKYFRLNYFTQTLDKGFKMLYICTIILIYLTSHYNTEEENEKFNNDYCYDCTGNRSSFYNP